MLKVATVATRDLLLHLKVFHHISSWLVSDLDSSRNFSGLSTVSLSEVGNVTLKNLEVLFFLHSGILFGFIHRPLYWALFENTSLQLVWLLLARITVRQAHDYEVSHLASENNKIVRKRKILSQQRQLRLPPTVYFYYTRHAALILP